MSKRKGKKRDIPYPRQQSAKGAKPHTAPPTRQLAYAKRLTGVRAG